MSVALPDDQAGPLAAWFVAVGPRRRDETFGTLLVRVAAAQLGKPYFDEPWHPGPETLRCRLDSFECVSLVESSLALGRCIWTATPTAACFVHELQDLRYRDGRLDGYASRLHYYEEWLQNNARRGHLQILTADLGGEQLAIPFFFMTGNPTRFPALQDPNIRLAIAATEARLSDVPILVVSRKRLRVAQRQLQNGDVIAIASDVPGILVSHTGFISRGKDGVVHLLHASSYRKKVVLSEGDLAGYVLRRPERRGILVARPVPPAGPEPATGEPPPKTRAPVTP